MFFHKLLVSTGNSVEPCVQNTSLTDLLLAISSKDPDKVSIRLANALEIIAELETIQVDMEAGTCFVA